MEPSCSSATATTASDPLESLSIEMPPAQEGRRESAGLIVLREHRGSLYALLIQNRFSNEMKDVCYLLGSTGGKGKDVEARLTEEVSKLCVEEYKTLLDLGRFSVLLESMYHYKPSLATRVLAAYENVKTLLPTLKCSGKDFEVGYSFPKGASDRQGQSRGATLVREIFEEIGIKPDRYAVLPIAPCEYEIKVKEYVFAVHLYFGSLAHDVIYPVRGEKLSPMIGELSPRPMSSHEIMKVEFVPVSLLPTLLAPEIWDALKKSLADYSKYCARRIEKDVK